jgi:hypothetical protein
MGAEVVGHPGLMANDSNRPAPPCAECGRPAIVAYDQGGGRYLSFCLTHARVYQEMNVRTIEALQEQADRFEDEINDTWGLPRNPRPRRIPAPRVNVHQVNIHGDNLGVVNTGVVQSLSNNISVVHGQNAELAGQLKQLTEAILRSEALDATQKREAADLLNAVVEDAATPEPQRKSRAVMKTIATGLGQVLGHSADLYTLWTAIAPHLPF